MAITRVQSKTANSGGTLATSLVVTLDSTPTAGNLLVAILGTAPAGGGTHDFSQTGVIWFGAPKSGASNCQGWLMYGVVLSGAGAALTITAPSSGLSAVVAEYSGNNLRVDQYAAATGTGTSAASGATGTTSVADELWVGGIVARNSVTFSAPTNSFSIVGQDRSTVGTANDRAVALLERIVTSTGTANAGATVSASNVWTAQVMTIREVVSGSSGGCPIIGGSIVRAA